MNRALFLLAAIAIASAQTIICPTGQVYAKITKMTASWASEESFKILSGATELYTSPSLVNNAERILEICLAQTTNNVYTLQMKDSCGDSWSNMAWISIEGINGNLVFKQMMTAGSTEEYQFSLYSPVNKGSTWKYTANASGTWTMANYPDQSWTDVVTGTTAQTATGTQYFRHTFTGAANFAAVEFQMNYRYGAIAYINGQEVYRDNMAAGPVTAASTAEGSYPTISYHGAIRSADVAEAVSNVFAVELHFLTTSYSETIQFNGFLSLLAGIAADNKCFVLPQDPSVTNSGFTSPDYAFNWSRNSYAYTSTSGSYLTADYTAITARGEINGFRLWPYSSTTYAINTFTVSGAQMISGPFDEVFTTAGAVYTSSQWKQWVRVTPSQRYTYLRLTAQASQSTTMYVYEFQFMVCNAPPPTMITYTQTKTSFYRNYETVDIRPDNYGFANCQINPTLPAGLVWNSATCSVSGIPTEARAQQSYTVSTMVGTIQATGTISLTVTDCASSLYKIVRTYKSSPQNEYFRIYDTATSTTIYEVTQGHTHSASVDWTHFICISQERFDVVFYHTGTYWMSDSYFYMYYLLPNDEQEMVVKGRFDNYEQVVNNQYLRRPTVGHSEQWKYKFDSVPANWYNADVFNSWSQNTRGSFGTATNKVQLFAKTFNVNTLNQVKGYILSIRYKYGCVVYLNGHEAFRNGVTGDITSSPSATNSYNDVLYHVVTLPGKTIPTTAQPTAINYLQQGTNTIAIALVALADTQTTVDFDCIVRLMPADQSESHIWEYSGSYSGMYGGTDYPFNMYYGYSMYYSSTSACTTNYYQITLANDRREWISSMHIQNYYTSSSTYDYPTQLKVYGRNGSDEWTLLKEVTGLAYSMPGQKRRIYFQNNIPYNQFRFENIFPANHASRCYWRMQSLDLYADNVLAELAPLVYPTSVEIFKDIEMSEVIPTGDGYGDFTINPLLPAGVNLDAQTGWISGTASAIAATQTYTITANKVTGGTATATISIAVAVCTGGRSLMTVRFHADSYMSENSWKLYQGRGTTGTVLDSVTSFPVANAYYYVDFCLNDGIYTLEGQDTYGDGWSVNNGYTLTADVGEMELEIQEMYSGTSPVKVSSVFSTYFPFQFEYSDWKINQTGFVEGWTGISFDDSTWLTKKANEIPTTEQITTYIRKTFTITNVADYQVLNIRMKYSGGVVAYFNGNMVARINIVEYFEDTTESIEVHDSTIDGKFHIILPTAGVVEGTNVIAFEIHRPMGTPSSEPVVFDATGVFGVDDCSVVIDSYSELTSTATTAGTLEGIMDLDPYTTGTLPNTIDTYVQWTVDNRMGSKWNKFNIHCSGSRSSWGFRIYATSDPEEQGAEPIIAYQGTDLTINGRTRPNLEVPVALAGFRQYKWEIIDTSSSNYALNAMFGVYCKATGAVCPAIDNYPSVGEGQISPASCPEGYRGYAYRECAGGQLGEVKMDKCSLRPPMNARYSKSRFQLVKDVKVTTGVPEVRGIVARWYLDTGVFLPEGLSLNELTGEISGIPKDTMDMTSFTVYAENSSGATSAVVTLSVRVGQCMAEGVFPVTEVGQVAVYECSLQGSYVGTQKRACILGAEDGEWQKASGMCMSIGLIVVLVIIVIIVVFIAVMIFMRSTRKAKAVGGVKGKKSTKSAKSGASKKASTKAVKV